MIPENASEQQGRAAARVGAWERESLRPGGTLDAQHAARHCGRSVLKIILLTALIAAIYVLHQDFWNWKKAFPLVLGFLPIGLAYQAAYSILAAAMMALLVKMAWPKHLEQVEPESSGPEGHRS